LLKLRFDIDVGLWIKTYVGIVIVTDRFICND